MDVAETALLEKLVDGIAQPVAQARDRPMVLDRGRR